MEAFEEKERKEERKNWTRSGTPYLREAVKRSVLTSYLRRNTRSDADKVDGLSKWTYSYEGHAPADGSAARYRSSPFHTSSSSSSFAIRPLIRVSFFFFFYVQQLSFPFQRFFFLLFFLSVTQLRMVAGHFWMAENETGKRGRLGCNSRDAVNAALRRKSRPFFDGNARVNVHPCSYYRFIDHFEGKFFQTLR